MAKDKIDRDRDLDRNIKNDLDMGSLDSISLDLPGFGDEGIIKGKGRKPSSSKIKYAIESGKAIGGGVLEGAKQAFYNAVPNAEPLVSDVTDTLDDMRALKQDISKDLQPIIISVENAGRKFLPKAEKFIPKKVYNKIKETLDRRAAERRVGVGPSKSQLEQTEITDALTSIFGATAEMNLANQREQKKEGLVDRAVGSIRHKQNFAQMTHIYDAVRSTELFHRTQHMGYMKKSLELKYKHLFIARDTFNLLQSSLKTYEGYFKAITDNTALPDVMKKQMTDFIHGSRTERYGTLMTNAMSNIRKKIFENIKNTAKSAIDILGMGTMGLDMASQMEGMEGFEDPNKPKVPKFLLNLLGHAAGRFGLGAKFGYGNPLARALNGGIAGMRINALNKYSEIQQKMLNSTNPLFNFLADILPNPFKEQSTASNDLLTKSKNPAVFDVLTRQSIVEIIPGYLGKIWHEVEMLRTGDINVEEKAYNVFSRGFTTKSEIKADIAERAFGSEEDRRRTFTRAISAIEGGLASNKPKHDLKAQLDDKKEIIHKIILNHGFRSQPFSPDQLSEYVVSGKMTPYITKIISGIREEPQKIRSSIQAILDAIYIGDNENRKIDPIVLGKINEIITNAYLKNDKFRDVLPAMTEDQGYSWAVQGELNGREERELRKSLKEWSARAAKGDVQAIAKRNEIQKILDEKQGLISRDVSGSFINHDALQRASKIDYDKINVTRDANYTRQSVFEESVNLKEQMAKASDIGNQFGAVAIKSMSIRLGGFLKKVGGFFNFDETSGWVRNYDAMAKQVDEETARKLAEARDTSYLKDKTTGEVIGSGQDYNKIFGIKDETSPLRDTMTSEEAAKAASEKTGTEKAKEKLFGSTSPGGEKKQGIFGSVLETVTKAGKKSVRAYKKSGFIAGVTTFGSTVASDVDKKTKGTRKVISKKWKQGKKIVTKSDAYRSGKRKLSEYKKKISEWKQKFNQTETGKKTAEALAVLEKLYDEASSKFDECWESLNEMGILDKPEELVKYIREHYPEYRDILSDLPDLRDPAAVEQKLSEIATQAKDLGKKAADAVTDPVSKVAEAVREKINEKPAEGGKSIAEKVTELTDKAVEQGKTAKEGVFDFFVNFFSKLKSGDKGTPGPGAIPKPEVIPPTSEGGTPPPITPTGPTVDNVIEEEPGEGNITLGSIYELMQEWRADVTDEHMRIVKALQVVDGSVHNTKDFQGGKLGAYATVWGDLTDKAKKIGKGAWSVTKKIGKAYTQIYKGALQGFGTAIKGVADLGRNALDKAWKGVTGVGKWLTSQEDYVDIYVKGKENRPIVSARMQRDPDEGIYFKGGKRVEHSRDIDQPCYDKNGNLVITEEDLEKGLVMNNGTPIGKLGKGLLSLGKSYFKMLGIAVGGGLYGIGKIVGSVINVLGGGNLPTYFDVYRKGEIEKGPILTGKKQREEGVYFLHSGKKVERTADIDEEVMDKDRQVIISKEDIEHGLVGVNGKPLGYMKSLRQTLLSGMKGIGAFALGAAKKAGNFYLDFYSKLLGGAGGLLKGALKGIGGFIGRGLGLTSGKDVIGFDDEARKALLDSHNILSTMQKDLALIADQYRNKNPNDDDNDGDIDGSYKDQMEKREQKGKSTADKLKDQHKDVDWNKKETPGSGDGDGGSSYLQDMAEWELMKWFAKKLGKRKGAWKFMRKLHLGKHAIKNAVKLGWKAGGIKGIAKNLFTKGGYLASKMAKGAGAAGKAAGATGKAAGALGKMGGALSAVGGKVGGFLSGTGGKVLGKAAVPIAVGATAVLGGVSAIKSYKKGDTKEGNKAVGGTAGSIGGMFAGAKAGAALGALVGGPAAPITAAIGGLLGSVIGGVAGNKLGKGLGGLFGKNKAEKEKEAREKARKEQARKRMKPVERLIDDKKQKENSFGSKVLGAVTTVNPVLLALKAIKRNEMTAEEIEAGRGRLLRKVQQKKPGYDKILSEYEKAVTDKNWSRARALSGKEADGFISTLWKESLPGKVLATEWKWIFGDKNKEMTPEEIQKTRARFQSIMKKGGSAGKNAEKLLSKFDDYVADHDWKNARKIAGAEKQGLFGAIFKDDKGNVKWARLAGAAMMAIPGFQLIGGALIAGDGLISKNENKPMSEKEIKDAQDYFQNQIKSGNKSAQKILNQFNEAVTEQNWKKARKLAGKEVKSALSKLVGGVGTAGKFMLRSQAAMMTAGLSEVALGFIGDQDKPMSDDEIKKFRDKMNFLITKHNDKVAERKLEKFDEYIARQQWEKARKIAHMPHKGWAMRATKAVTSFFFGDDEKEMKPEEIQKFRDSMNRKIAIGGRIGRVAQKKLDSFEDAVGAQRWKKARLIAQSPDEGVAQKVGNFYMKSWAAQLRFVFGGDGKPMSEAEIEEARKKLGWAVSEGKPKAQKRLDMFEDFVKDEKWEKARRLVKMPYDNIVKRRARALGGFLFGSDKDALTPEEIKKFQDECEQKVADGQGRYSKVLAAFNSAVEQENWKKARLIAKIKPEGVVQKVGKALNPFNWFKDSYEDCQKLKEEIEEKSLDDETGVISQGLEEFEKLVRRRKYKDAMSLGKDLLKMKPSEFAKKHKIKNKKIEEYAKRAGDIEKELIKRISAEKSFFSIKRFRLKGIRSDLMADPASWSDEFLDDIEDRMHAISGTGDYAKEEPDDKSVFKGNQLIHDIDKTGEKFSWLTSPIIKTKLKLLKSKIRSSATEWDEDTLFSWREELKEIAGEKAEDSRNRPPPDDKVMKDANTLLKDIEKTKEDLSMFNVIGRTKLNRLKNEIESDVIAWTPENVKRWRKNLKEIGGDKAADSREIDKGIETKANTLLDDINKTDEKISRLRHPIIKRQLANLRSEIESDPHNWSLDTIRKWRNRLNEVAGKEAVDSRGDAEKDQDEKFNQIGKKLLSDIEETSKKYSWTNVLHLGKKTKLKALYNEVEANQDKWSLDTTTSEWRKRLRDIAGDSAVDTRSDSEKDPSTKAHEEGKQLIGDIDETLKNFPWKLFGNNDIRNQLKSLKNEIESDPNRWLDKKQLELWRDKLHEISGDKTVDSRTKMEETETNDYGTKKTRSYDANEGIQRTNVDYTGMIEKYPKLKKICEDIKNNPSLSDEQKADKILDVCQKFEAELRNKDVEKAAKKLAFEGDTEEDHQQNVKFIKKTLDDYEKSKDDKFFKKAKMLKPSEPRDTTPLEPEQKEEVEERVAESTNALKQISRLSALKKKYETGKLTEADKAELSELGVDFLDDPDEWIRAKKDLELKHKAEKQKGFEKKFADGGLIDRLNGGLISKGWNWFKGKFVTEPTTDVDKDGNPIQYGEAGTEAILPITRKPGNLLDTIVQKVAAILNGEKLGPESTTSGSASVHTGTDEAEPLENKLSSELAKGITSKFENRFANGGFSDLSSEDADKLKIIANLLGILGDPDANDIDHLLDVYNNDPKLKTASVEKVQSWSKSIADKLKKRSTELAFSGSSDYLGDAIKELFPDFRSRFSFGGFSRRFSRGGFAKRFADGGFFDEGPEEEGGIGFRKSDPNYIKELAKKFGRPLTTEELLKAEKAQVEKAKNSESSRLVDEWTASGMSNDEIQYRLGMQSKEARDWQQGDGGYADLKYRVLEKLGWTYEGNEDSGWRLVPPSGWSKKNGVYVDPKGRTIDEAVLDFLSKNRDNPDAYARTRDKFTREEWEKELAETKALAAKYKKSNGFANGGFFKRFGSRFIDSIGSLSKKDFLPSSLTDIGKHMQSMFSDPENGGMLPLISTKSTIGKGIDFIKHKSEDIASSVSKSFDDTKKAISDAIFGGDKKTPLSVAFDGSSDLLKAQQVSGDKLTELLNVNKELLKLLTAVVEKNGVKVQGIDTLIDVNAKTGLLVGASDNSTTVNNNVEAVKPSLEEGIDLRKKQM